MRTILLILSFGALLLASACSQPASNSNNNGNGCTPACDGLICGDDGCGGTCGECATGEVCNSGICAPGTCGNGTLDDGETCDESAGRACPTEAGCEPLDGCFSSAYSGSPQTCDAVCETTQIEMCVDGDGCCPVTCQPGNDRDCVPDTCGNGVVDPGENCDGPDFPCLTSAECQPSNECEIATLIGYDFACSVSCQRADINACLTLSDGCCPAGCDFTNDADCAAPVCGDGIVDIGERCDTMATGDELCPDDCNDNRACTTDLVNGEDCNVYCSNATQSACANGDGCCPPGCTPAQDDDCNNVMCGDGVVDGDEGCDNTIPAGEPGACPASDADCDDGDPCTTDMMVGNAADCSARCVTDAIACADGDGCCPFACTETNDAECAALDLCSMMCFQAITYCMGANEIFASTDECLTACADMAIGREDEVTTDTVYCRLNHLPDAMTDPETHCPHSAPVAVDGCSE